jgi:signal transduction histidine kinase
MLLGRPVKLVTEIEGDFPLMACDKRRVRQVLINLLGNAAKFTEQGTITLSARRGGSDEVFFSVVDSGPGITPEEQKMIFEPFVQTEHGIQHAGGTGLGLPISKSLVEAHGADCGSSTPGKGSAFHVALPRRRRSQQQAQPTAETQPAPITTPAAAQEPK